MTLTRPGLLRLLWSSGAAVAVLLLAEIAIRSVDHRLETPLSWYSPRAEYKAGELERLATDDRPVDVAFVGSSIVDRDIDVEAFERATGLTAWNGGLPAAQATVIRRWTFDEVLPATDPEVVVVGLSSLELNDGRRLPTIELYDTQLHSRTGVLADLDRFASEHSHLFRHRRQLRLPASLYQDVLDVNTTETVEFDEAAIVARHAQRIADNVLNDYTLGPRELGALEDLLRTLVADDRTVIVVWMPVTTIYIGTHPDRDNDFAAAQAAARDVSEALGIPFVDLSDTHPDTDFSDVTHLRPAAAAAFTDRLVAALAELGVIPLIPAGRD